MASDMTPMPSDRQLRFAKAARQQIYASRLQDFEATMGTHLPPDGRLRATISRSKARKIPNETSIKGTARGQFRQAGQRDHLPSFRRDLKGRMLTVGIAVHKYNSTEADVSRYAHIRGEMLYEIAKQPKSATQTTQKG